jgi:cytochrome b561
MLIAVVLAWVFMAMPAEEVGRFVYITLHKSIGQTIFFLTLVRLIWRRSHAVSPMRGRIAVWEVAIARMNHWLLYVVMILMPLTGYVLATAAARPSPYFWLFYWPQPAVSAVVAARCAAGPSRGPISRLRDGWPPRIGRCLARRRSPRWDS